MSTDKLQALSDTIAGILNEPPSPVTYFDPEPHDEASAGERAAKGFDDLAHGIDAPKGSFGKLSSREAGISGHPAPEAQIESQRRASDHVDVAAGPGQPSKLEAASLRRNPRAPGVDVVRPAVSGRRTSLRRWGAFVLAAIMLATGLGVTAVVWLGPSGDAAKANSQTSPAIAAVSAALPPELAALLQSMSHDLASLRGDIEQLKRGREQMARDSADFGEQFRASQDQLGRSVARLSDQVKAGQELAERDNANAAEQIKAVRDQLIRLEQNAAPKKLTPPQPRVAAPAAPAPAPTASSPQAATQPAAAKPKPMPTRAAPPAAVPAPPAR
ncbi:hypothetical protein ACRQ5Q_27430 [Bradyrhizobium sp. PMVTL-01]|uniref:hypothetical protein n=1 Tax=Bradyrhizobium sp. PMVTL-01 TaxID=3434999 RepID=UPI003F6EC92A